MSSRDRMMTSEFTKDLDTVMGLSDLIAEQSFLHERVEKSQYYPMII